MKWWREAKYGMFIHWGLYSLLGREAWAMGDEDIPLADYEKLAMQVSTATGCSADMGATGAREWNEIHGVDHETP